MEIGRYAVKIFQKNEKFLGIKRKKKKNKKKEIECYIDMKNGVVKRKIKKQKN